MGVGAQLFDTQASSYALYRPDYPDELYKRVIRYCDFSGKPQRALDIATGSGQAAVALAIYFDQVIAIDSSVEQLRQAKQRDNVTYQKGLAEETGIASNSIDLVTVAQATHWFDHAKFFAECARVLKPGGVLAFWGYGLPVIQGFPEATELIADLANSKDKMGPYWAPERKHIDEEYCNIHPDENHYESVTRQSIVSTAKRTIDALVGYLSTWSPYSTWRKKEHDKEDPLISFKAKILKTCNTSNGSFELTVETSLFLILARRTS